MTRLMTLTLVLVPLFAWAQVPPPNHDSLRVVKGELLVKYRRGLHGPAAARVQQAFKHQVKRTFDHLGWQHIQIAAGATDAEALVHFRQHPDVLAAEPNYVFHLARSATMESA